MTELRARKRSLCSNVTKAWWVTAVSGGCQRPCLWWAQVRAPTCSGSLSMDTERYRLAGTVTGSLRTSSSATPRCWATSLEVLRVAVAVRPRKQRTPRCSRSTYVGAEPERVPKPSSLACSLTPTQAHLAETQVAGPEVVGPLGKAVGLIDTGKSNRRQLREAARGPQPSPNQRLGRQHQHVHLGRLNLRARSGASREGRAGPPPVLPGQAPHLLQGRLTLLPGHARMDTGHLQARGQARHLQGRENNQ